MKEKISKSAHIFVALAVPLAFLVGTLTSLVFKTTNPDHVDITADLAYLKPSLYAGYGTLLVLLSLGLIASLLSFKSGAQKYAKTTLITLLIIVVCVAGSALAQKRTDQVEATYSKQQVQSLFKQMFLKVPAQK